MSILLGLTTGRFKDVLYTIISLLVVLSTFRVALKVLLSWNSKNNVPWGLRYMRYVPRWVSGILHSRNALRIMSDASKRHSGRAFRVPRHDIDIIVLPEATVDELAGLPNDAASNILALQYDLVGQWTGLGMLNDMNLHYRVVQRRITPRLMHLTPGLEEEITAAIESYFPQQSDRWHTITPYPIMNRLAARVFSRLVVGPEYCRDDRWLQFAMNFTENVFNSIVLMRYFPPWMYPILYYLLPSVKQCVQNVHEAETLMAPVFKKLLEAHEDKAEKDPSVEDNCLGWLCDLANGGERNPIAMVHAQILLALGAIHTSLFAELNILYDLMANPADLEAVRAEIEEEAKKGWTYDTYARLYKLDSILRESQRLAPPYLIGLRRIMKEDYTFANGTSVHAGDYVCVLTPTVQNTHLDADEDPDRFYGLRSYDQKANEDALDSTKYQYATTDTSVMGFGQGRTACPGRWTASLTLKMIFVKLLTEYDFEFLDPLAGRPQSVYANEIISPDPKVKIRIKKRKSFTTTF